METQQALGALIATLRRHRGLSQRVLAAAVPTSQVTLSRWERVVLPRVVPDAHALTRLAAVLLPGRSPGALLDLVGATRDEARRLAGEAGLAGGEDGGGSSVGARGGVVGSLPRAALDLAAAGVVRRASADMTPGAP